MTRFGLAGDTRNSHLKSEMSGTRLPPGGVYTYQVMVLKGLGLDFVHFLCDGGLLDAVEKVGEGVQWSKAERPLGLLDEGAELAGVAVQVLVGHLEGEEEEAGGRAVEPAADDSGDHFRQGELDGGAVFEAGQVEDGRSWLSPGCRRTPAGGVVVVTELLAAEGGRAAGFAVGVKVAAGGIGRGHGGLLGLNAKGPARMLGLSL